jgi:hypothetical protein
MTHACRRRVLSFLAAPVLLLIAGCADTLTDPVRETVPPRAASLSSSGGEPEYGGLARFTQTRSVTVGWARKWIGPEGGRLDFAGFAIEVPPGAVDRLTPFSIRLPVDTQGSQRVVAEFGPHGATFRKPVAIEFPQAGTSIERVDSPTVVWWNGSWVDMGGIRTANGARLRTTTDHFSTYGTTDGRGPVLVSGG